MGGWLGRDLAAAVVTAWLRQHHDAIEAAIAVLAAAGGIAAAVALLLAATRPWAELCCGGQG